MTQNKATTDAAPATGEAPGVDPKRAAWFTSLGYGADSQVVTLRNGLGTASAADVWMVLVGLRALQSDHRGLFHRIAAAAHGDRRPIDVDGHLHQQTYGALTDGKTWLNGRREIVVALLDIIDDDGMAVFAEAPFVTVELPKAT